MTWLRWPADEQQRPELRLAGWQATLIWPYVVAAVRRRGGVVGELDLHTQVVARDLNGAPEDVVADGLEALKRVGLVIHKTAVCKRGRGTYEITGFSVPNERSYMPDSRVRTRTSLPLGNDPGSNRDETGLARKYTLTSSKKKKEIARDPGMNRDVERLWETYRGYRPKARATPSAGWRRCLQRRLKDFSADDLDLVLRWAHESDDYAFQRANGYARLDSILREEKLEGRLEQAQAWKGGAFNVTSHPAYRALAPADRDLLCSWPSERQIAWRGLVEDGNSGATALLLVEQTG